MGGERRKFRSLKAMTGATLAGLGLFILYGNLAGAVVGLEQVLGANGSSALGIVPAFLLSVSHTVQAFANGHRGVVHCLLQRLWVTSWPLLLVKVGTVLTRENSFNSSP
jgi:hypothetical protein